MHVFVRVRVQLKIVTGIPRERFQILRGRCTFLPSPYALTSLCAPGYGYSHGKSVGS